MTEWLWPVLSLLVLLALSAFFSSIETALFSLGRIQTRRLAEQLPAVGAVVTELLAMPRRVLSTILLGNTLTSITATVLMYWLLLRSTTPSHAAFWTVVIIVGLLVTVGELAPKLLATLHPVRVVRWTARPIRAVAHTLGPLLVVSQKLSDAFLKLVSSFIGAAPAASELSEEEVRTLLEVSLQQGVLRESEKNMIQEILRLRQHSARDLLTPRVDMVCVSATMPKPELIEFLKKTRHRRVPVYDGTPDTIVGILDVRRYLLAPEEDVIEIMDPPSFVPESMNAVRLLKSFQSHKRPMAVVVDEFGGTEGLLTMADILEEIVGELADEFRHPEQELEKLTENSWRARGWARLDNLQEQIGWRVTTPHGVDTIGGFVATLTGGIPRSGATVKVEGWQITVERLAKNRISLVRLERLKEDA